MSDDALASLSQHLRTRWLGRAHEHHGRIGSTNDRAAAWSDAPHGALVTADQQDAGRGRFGRVWHSPAGASLYASFVLRPPHADARWSALGLVVGVGLYEALAGTVGGLGLRWPNDLLVGGRKLGGILCEGRWAGATPQFVVGFGLNVRAQPWPSELAAIATSIEQAAGERRDRVALLAAVLHALEPCLEAFARDGFAAVRDRYEAACVSLGTVVAVSVDGGRARRHVRAIGLDHDGALLVQGEAGRERIEAGELLPSG